MIAVMDLAGALLTGCVAILKRDPLELALLVGGILLPGIWPIAVGSELYWMAWWVLLFSLVAVSTASHLSSPKVGKSFTWSRWGRPRFWGRRAFVAGRAPSIPVNDLVDGPMAHSCRRAWTGVRRAFRHSGNYKWRAR